MDLSALPASRMRDRARIRARSCLLGGAGAFRVGRAASARHPARSWSCRASRISRASLVARALAHGGPVIVDGPEDRRRRFPAQGSARARRCGISRSPRRTANAPWSSGRRRRWPTGSCRTCRTGSGWVTAPGGLFGRRAGPGSVALGRALPDALPGRVADLGAGWGYLAFQALERSGVAEIAPRGGRACALEAARANIRDDRAHFHWADAPAMGGAGALRRGDLQPALPHLARGRSRARGRLHRRRGADPDAATARSGSWPTATCPTSVRLASASRGSATGRGRRLQAGGREPSVRPRRRALAPGADLR